MRQFVSVRARHPAAPRTTGAVMLVMAVAEEEEGRRRTPGTTRTRRQSRTSTARCTACATSTSRWTCSTPRAPTPSPPCADSTSSPVRSRAHPNTAVSGWVNKRCLYCTIQFINIRRVLSSDHNEPPSDLMFFFSKIVNINQFINSWIDNNTLIYSVYVFLVSYSLVETRCLQA